MPTSSRVSPEKVEIEIGTDWEPSSRFLAVTMTSSEILLKVFWLDWENPKAELN